MNTTKRQFGCMAVVLVGAGILTQANLAYGTEICPTNSGGPDLCLDWNLPGAPEVDVHFALDYFTDPANPNVTLWTGAAWNVRSKDNAGNPANIGDIKIDATLPADVFEMSLMNATGGPGAANVGSIILSDATNWTGHSSITAREITGNLTRSMTDP